MELTIIILILGFCHSECYAKPNRCICAPNPGVTSPITGLHPYDHEQVQKSKQSEYELGEYGENGNRLKQEINLRNLLELFEHLKKRNSKNNRSVATTGILGFVPARPLGKIREESGQTSYTGMYNPSHPRTGRRSFGPDIQLQQEYVREPNLSADAAYGDYE